MSQIRKEVTSNLKTGNDFKEYDKLTYQCPQDDIWVTAEFPKSGDSTKNIV